MESKPILREMSGYALTPRAKADVFEIWSYIAEDNVAAADRVENAIYEACEFLAGAPLCGHHRPELTPRHLRFWTAGRYRNVLIVYRPDTKPIQIVAVLHGRRDVRRILTGPQ